MKRKLAISGLVVLVGVIFLYSFLATSPLGSDSSRLTGFVVLDSGVKVSTEKLDSSLVQAIQEGDSSPRVVVILDSSGTSIDSVEQSVVSSLDSSFDVAVEGDAEASIVDAVEPNTTKMSEEADVTVTHAFDSVSALSLDVTSPDALLALTQNTKVQRIMLDYPVNLSLDDSVPLTAAPRVWNLSSGVDFGNRTITGVGNSVCVIDTGVDYTHSALGKCSIVSFNVTGTPVNYSLESSHPYANSLDYTWKIQQLGYSSIAIHFQNISLESQSMGDTTDRVYVYDASNNTVAVYKGNMSNVWTPQVEGDTIYVRLVTDSGVTSFGFAIDSVLNGTTNSTLHWENCSVVIGGYDTYNGDSDPMDDHGHGTHVAGIIASQNATYRGVAPGAKIVALKALSSHGGGYSSDVLSAIEWCNSNSARLNITVISMSLGCDGSGCPHYGGYCDNDLLSNVINESVMKNISVFIAAGNAGWTDGISNPSCIENAIPIGGETMNRTVVFNRGGVLRIIAPGINVRSPVPGESWATWSGTSMATPHAAGVATLMQQYSKEVYGRMLRPDEIESRLEKTSTFVYDNASSKNYTLLDAFGSTIAQVNVSNVSRTVLGLNFSVDVHSDYEIRNLSLVIGFDNDSITLGPVVQNATYDRFDYVFNSMGSAWYQVVYYDPAGNRFASANYTIAVESPTLGVVLLSPVNGSYYSSQFTLQGNASVHNLTVLNGSVIGPFSYNESANENLENETEFNQSEGNISNLTIHPIYFLVGNDSQNVSFVSDVNVSGFDEGIYLVNFVLQDVELNLTLGREIIIDHTSPNITHSVAVVNWSNVTISAQVLDRNLDSVVIQVVNSSNVSVNYTMDLLDLGEYNVSFLSIPGDFNYSIIATDKAGNQQIIEGNYSVESTHTIVTVMSPVENATVQFGEEVVLSTLANLSSSYEYTVLWGDNSSITNLSNSSIMRHTKNYSSVGNKTIVMMINTSGEMSNVSRHIFVVDTKAPEFNMVVQNPMHTALVKSLTFNVTDLSQIDAVEMTINNRSSPVECLSSSLLMWQCTAPLPLFTAGNYTFSFLTRDYFQNENVSQITITVQTCADGLQNGDELGSDCGGSCPACPTSTPVAIQQATAAQVLSQSPVVQNTSEVVSTTNLSDDSVVASSRASTQQSLLYVLVFVIALLIFLYAALYRP